MFGNFLLTAVVCWAGPAERDVPNIFPFWGFQEYFRQRNIFRKGGLFRGTLRDTRSNKNKKGRFRVSFRT